MTKPSLAPPVTKEMSDLFDAAMADNDFQNIACMSGWLRTAEGHLQHVGMVVAVLKPPPAAADERWLMPIGFVLTADFLLAHPLTVTAVPVATDAQDHMRALCRGESPVRVLTPWGAGLACSQRKLDGVPAVLLLGQEQFEAFGDEELYDAEGRSWGEAQKEGLDGA
jgi:hypothetical protein